MYLHPIPKIYREVEGEPFLLSHQCEISLSIECNNQDLESAKVLKSNILELLKLDLKINKSYIEMMPLKSIRLIKENGIKEESYILTINEDIVEVRASTSTGMFYGVQTFIQLIKNEGVELSPVIIEDEPYFKNRGFYHDVTRGKVPTLKTLMDLVDKLSHYKMNQLQLYIEHSFAFKGFSEMWCDKDPLTAEEILLLDEYCQKRHVELVPSIATFGHLYELLRTESYHEFCELGYDESEYSFCDRMAHHTLDVSNEKSFEVVEKMVKDFLPLFSSNKFNICCDETFDLAKGKSKHLLENQSLGEVYVNFLNKIINLAKSHQKEVLFWGDIILHYEHLLSKIDSQVTCLNWNYSHICDDSQTKSIAKSGVPQYVCPGVAGWNKLMNLMDHGYENIRRMISYGVRYGAIGVLTTDWGDFGHLNLLGSSVPLMIDAASMSWNPLIEIDKDEVFKGISLLEYQDRTLTLVPLLVKLSECQKFSWFELVIWKEKFDMEIRDLMIKEYSTFNPKVIREDYFKAKEIERELYTRLPHMKINNQIEMQEFLVASEGISLINDFALHLLKNELNLSTSEPVNDAFELAQAFELWLQRYKNIWRLRNKESELNQIVNVIKYLCKYLRTH